MLEELKDLERIIGSKIFSANIQLDDKYGKVFETKIYRENNEISIDEPHAYLGTINDEHISVIKEFITHFFKQPQGPAFDYLSKIIWLDDKILDRLIPKNVDAKQKILAKYLLRSTMIGHEGIEGHLKSIIHPFYGEITMTDVFVALFSRSSDILWYYMFDGVAHEAFAMFNEELIWKEYEIYLAVMRVKNELRKVREEYWIYEKAYELIDYLQTLRNFDYSEAKKLLNVPPKPIVLRYKRSKRNFIVEHRRVKFHNFSRPITRMLYDIIFLLRKGFKLSDIKGKIEEIIERDVQEFKEDHPEYEEIDISSIPRLHRKEVVANNSYFCIFPNRKEKKYFEFYVYALIGYTSLNSQEILEIIINSMKFFIWFSVTMNNPQYELLKRIYTGEYLVFFSEDLRQGLAYDSKQYHEIFINELFHGNLSKYETLDDLIENILKLVLTSLEPIKIFKIPIMEL
jgi:hypothetical protein